MVMFNPEIMKKSQPYRYGGGLSVPGRHPSCEAVEVHQGPLAE